VNSVASPDLHPCESLPETASFAFVDAGETVLVYVDAKAGRPFHVMRTASDFRPGDGYRWYQVFCLAFASVLGWSPILRDALGLKRRSNRMVEKGQDGVRAQMIEEYVIALALVEEDWSTGLAPLSHSAIAEIQAAVASLEVCQASEEDWRCALDVARDAWKALKASGGGIVTMDCRARNLRVSSFPASKANDRGQAVALAASKAFDIEKLTLRVRETKQGVVELYREIAGGTWVNTGSKAEEWSSNPDDGFRWHDAFHLASLAKTGWSPVCVALCQQDGGVRNALRYELLEEAIVARAFQAFCGGGANDVHQVAQRASQLCATFAGVNIESTAWEEALLEGWRLRAELMSSGDGQIQVDIVNRHIEFHSM